jgi:MFS transporter, DHA3 family, macrolide efflux protein
LLLGVWRGFKRKVVTALVGVIISGLATLALGFTSLGLFFVGVAASFFVGAGLSFANGPIMATLQTIVAKDMQGRIFSLLSSVSSAIIPLGLAIAGPVADAIGIGPLYYICGIAIVITAVLGFFMPDLMNIENNSKRV